MRNGNGGGVRVCMCVVFYLQNIHGLKRHPRVGARSGGRGTLVRSTPVTLQRRHR